MLLKGLSISWIKKNNMITTDDFKEYALDILEKHYPKGSKGRGEAMVLVSDLILRHEDITKEIYVRRSNPKKDEVGNVGKPGIPKLSTGGGTIRSRLPEGPGDGATYRMGTRLIPKGKKA